MLLGLSHVKQLHSLFIMSIIRLIVAKKMYEILLLLICRRDLINVFCNSSRSCFGSMSASTAIPKHFFARPAV